MARGGPTSGEHGAPKKTDKADAADDATGTPKTEGADAADRSAEVAADHFVTGVLTRGEAARPDADGQLPPGTTHEIVDEDAEGNATKLKRRRYSAF